MDLRRIAESIAREMERETCRSHNQHPKLSVSGSSDNPSINVTACCDDFAAKVRHGVEVKLTARTKEAIEKELRDAFRRL